MWIFSEKAFLSIVRNTDKPGFLLVRSRFKGHIEKVFPKARVEEDPTRDYRFRAELTAKEVSRVIGKMVSEIDYDNFKASLEPDDQGYYESCIDTYYVVARNSADWNLDNSLYGRRETDETEQVKE